MNRPWVRKLIIVVGILGILSAFASVAAAAGVFWWYGRGVADLDEARLKDYRPPQVSRIYARDGELIGEIYAQRRTVIDYEAIPSHVENAFLAAEDADFYRHKGMDYMGMVRALVANVRAGEVRQGASTITQQVVKVFMLSPERSFERKVEELVLARRLEKAFTKQEILELYLNEIYLGHGRYGIEEASWFYFGKGITDIDLGQAALLATLPKAPGRDSPLQNPEKAKTRQVYVLEQMVKHGFATTDEAGAYMEGALELAAPDERRVVQSGAEEFVDAVKQQLRAQYGDELDTLGATVTTTVSMPLQKKALASVLTGLTEIDVRNGYAHALTAATEGELAEARQAARGPLRAGMRALGEVVALPPGSASLRGFAVKVGAEDVYVAVPDGSRYDDPEQTVAAQFPVGALVPVRVRAVAKDPPTDGEPSGFAQGEIDAGPEAAIVVANVERGEVLAMVGGSRYARAQFNRATQAKRQPGSAFKPFVYGAALQSKRFNPATLVADSPEVYDKWKPTNYTRDKYLGDIRMRVALAKSVNTVPIKITDTIGVDKVVAFAHAAGIESALPENLSLALGTGEVTPFEMLRAYLTLARGGERVEPALILSVERRGEPTWTPDAGAEQVFTPDVAFVLTSMMESVVTAGTGGKARKLGRPVAGKTGTSNDSHDAWFAGFTAEHVAVTWVGFDTPARIRKGGTGGSAALPIWLGAMQAAETGPSKAFVPPPSVSVRRIDAASGLLVPTGEAATGYTGVAMEEYFLAGTEPKEEAVPAALPKGDMLLGLYDDAGADDGDTPIEEDLRAGTQAEGQEPSKRPASQGDGTPAAERPTHAAARELPSLDDAP